MNDQPKKNIEAVHRHDLEELLKNLGLLEDFKAGRLRCGFCKDQIGEKNFGAIFPVGNEILFSCSKLECMAQLPNEKS